MFKYLVWCADDIHSLGEAIETDVYTARGISRLTTDKTSVYGIDTCLGTLGKPTEYNMTINILRVI